MALKIEIHNIRKKDYAKAIQFAIKGMHFDWYLNNQFLINAYGRYFWYQEINRATQIFAAYAEGEFLGVLLAEINGEKKKQQNLFQKLYVRLVDVIQQVLFEGAYLYEETTKKQLEHYLETNSPDGELIFLAVDPDCKIKGIGTMLLNSLEEKEKGKTLYLHTDDSCTYQFYEHRGFERVEETKIVLEMPKGKIPLRCFVYRKKI